MDKVPIVFEKDGKKFTIDFPSKVNYEIPRSYGFVQTQNGWLDSRSSNDETPLYLKNLDKPYYFEYLKDSKTVYVRQSQVLDDPDESIAEFY